MENLPHYHVQSTDVKHCSAGRKHRHHCVLWHGRTRCVLDGRSVEHSCCVPLAEVLGPRTPGEAKTASQFPPRIGELLLDPEDPSYVAVSEFDGLSLEEYQGPGAPSTTHLAMYQKQKRAAQLHLERQRRQYQLKLRMQHKKGQQTAPSEPTSVYQGQPRPQNQQHDGRFDLITTTAPVDPSLNTMVPSSPCSVQTRARGYGGMFSLYLSFHLPWHACAPSNRLP